MISFSFPMLHKYYPHEGDSFDLRDSSDLYAFKDSDFPVTFTNFTNCYGECYYYLIINWIVYDALLVDCLND